MLGDPKNKLTSIATHFRMEIQFKLERAPS